MTYLQRHFDVPGIIVLKRLFDKNVYENQPNNTFPNILRRSSVTLCSKERSSQEFISPTFMNGRTQYIVT